MNSFDYKRYADNFWIKTNIIMMFPIINFCYLIYMYSKYKENNTVRNFALSGIIVKAVTGVFSLICIVFVIWLVNIIKNVGY